MEGALEFEPRVTPLELFFDLVFVFAFTQVTSLMSADATAGGVLRGMLVLAALWWAWIVIIALGESIVAIGVGASGHPLDAGVVVAAPLGVGIAALLWWAYFDWVAIVAESRLAS